MTLHLASRSAFSKSVAALVSGTALAQGANLLFTPLITRIYGPEAYGGLGLYLAVVSFLVPLAGLCYPLALVLPKREREVKALLELAIVLSLIFSLICFTILWINYHFAVIELPFEYALLLIPAGVAASSFMALLTQYSIRKGRFKLLSSAAVLAAVMSGSIKLLLGLVAPSAESLIGATIVVLLLQCFAIAKVIGFKYDIRAAMIIKKAHLFVARKYIRFPVYRLPHATVASLTQVVPILMLSTLFGIKEAGYFALTKAVLAAPVTLVGKAIYDVSYPTINKRKQQGVDNYGFISKLTLVLAGLAIVPMLTFAFLGERIFEFVFGDEWRVSGTYAAWLSVWFAFNLLNRPSAASVSVYGLDGFLFRNGIVNLALCSAGFTIGYFVNGSDVLAVALFAVFGVISQLTLIIKALRTVKRSDSGLVIIK